MKQEEQEKLTKAQIVIGVIQMCVGLTAFGYGLYYFFK
jgi:hypothetical protein